MLTVDQARKILGKTAENMTDEEIEKLKSQLYQLVSQVVDNNLDQIKKQWKKQ